MDVLSVRLLLFAPMERWDEGGLFSEKGILWWLVMASRYEAILMLSIAGLI